MSSFLLKYEEIIQTFIHGYLPALYCDLPSIKTQCVDGRLEEVKVLQYHESVIHITACTFPHRGSFFFYPQIHCIIRQNRDLIKKFLWEVKVKSVEEKRVFNKLQDNLSLLASQYRYQVNCKKYKVDEVFLKTVVNSIPQSMDWTLNYGGTNLKKFYESVQAENTNVY